MDHAWMRREQKPSEKETDVKAEDTAAFTQLGTEYDVFPTAPIERQHTDSTADNSSNSCSSRVHSVPTSILNFGCSLTQGILLLAAGNGQRVARDMLFQTHLERKKSCKSQVKPGYTPGQCPPLVQGYR